MGVLRGDIAAKHMRDTLMEVVKNKDGVPLKDWTISEGLRKKIDMNYPHPMDDKTEDGK